MVGRRNGGMEKRANIDEAVPSSPRSPVPDSYIRYKAQINLDLRLLASLSHRDFETPNHDLNNSHSWTAQCGQINPF
jgi:hypothetical protein